MDIAVKKPVSAPAAPSVQIAPPKDLPIEKPIATAAPKIKVEQNKKSTSVVGLVVASLFFMIVLAGLAVVVYLKTRS